MHLFAGAGGGILADLLLGHQPVCAVEIDAYCQQVLSARQQDGSLPWFPIFGDITKFDGNPWRGLVDAVCGGFPCQDISAAYSLTLPDWGMMRDGELFRRQTPPFLQEIRAYITSVEDCGYSQKAPTPSTHMVHGGGGTQNLIWVRSTTAYRADGKKQQIDLAAFTRKFPTPRSSDGERGGRGDLIQAVRGNENRHYKLATPMARDWRSGKASQATMEKNSRPLSEQVGGSLNPPWVEWLMGFPIGWTDLEPLAMDKFRLWLQSHGAS